jgi:hypothetical protein
VEQQTGQSESGKRRLPYGNRPNPDNHFPSSIHKGYEMSTAKSNTAEYQTAEAEDYATAAPAQKQTSITAHTVVMASVTMNFAELEIICEILNRTPLQPYGW